MLCQHCKSQNATTHIHSVVNGVVTDKYLCSKCAEEYKTSGFESNDFLKMLSSFFGGEPKQSQASPTVKCVNCGITFEDICRTGKLGCAECYNTFRGQIEPTVLKLHGSLKHKGKTPDSNVQNQTMAVPEKQPESGVEALRKQLQEAILSEDFETAAVLRDKIKALGE